MAKANYELSKVRAIEERIKYGVGNFESVDIFKLLIFNEKINITKRFFENGFSGMIIEKGNVKMIILNSKMSLGRQNFTLAHELYHLKYDKLNNGDKAIESEANEFASYFLISENALDKKLLERECFKNGIAIEDIIYLEQYFMVSHKALLRRLKEKKFLKKEEFEHFENLNIKEMAHKLGYSSELYNPTNEEFKVYSELPELAQKALDKGLITASYYDQLLIQGGYADIVFGLGEDDSDE